MAKMCAFCSADAVEKGSILAPGQPMSEDGTNSAPAGSAAGAYRFRIPSRDLGFSYSAKLGPFC
jgi:hypothetical protein